MSIMKTTSKQTKNAQLSMLYVEYLRSRLQIGIDKHTNQPWVLIHNNTGVTHIIYPGCNKYRHAGKGDHVAFNSLPELVNIISAETNAKVYKEERGKKYIDLIDKLNQTNNTNSSSTTDPSLMIFNFGKYKGLKIIDVANTNPQYIKYQYDINPVFKNMIDKYDTNNILMPVNDKPLQTNKNKYTNIEMISMMHMKIQSLSLSDSDKSYLRFVLEDLQKM